MKSNRNKEVALYMDISIARPLDIVISLSSFGSVKNIESATLTPVVLHSAKWFLVHWPMNTINQCKLI